jgi:hypothetical protein
MDLGVALLQPQIVGRGLGLDISGPPLAPPQGPPATRVASGGVVAIPTRTGRRRVEPTLITLTAIGGYEHLIGSVYRVVAAMLVALAIVTARTGARTQGHPDQGVPGAADHQRGAAGRGERRAILCTAREQSGRRPATACCDVRPWRRAPGPHIITRRVAGAPRRRYLGDPLLHAQRPHGPGDRPVPSRVPARRPVARTRTVNALSLSWGVESLQVEEYTTTDELVWFAVETAMCHGCISHGDIVLVVAGAADRPKGAAPDVLRIVQVT